MLTKNGYHAPLIGDAQLQANRFMRARVTLHLGSTVMLVPPAAEHKKPGVIGIVYDKWLSAARLHNISSK